MNSARRQHGFTLIELITVMVLIGALLGVAAVFIVEPFRASRDMRERAALTDQADLALDRIVREVHQALPNSVRVRSSGGLTALEFVLTRTGGRYRRLPPPGGGGQTLDRAQSSGQFDALGGLPDIGSVVTGGAGTDCAAGVRDCISIYNTGQSGYNVYDGDNIAAITAKTDNSGTDQLTYDNGGSVPAFASHSPQQRFFVVQTVVSYVCPSSGPGSLQRYADYGLQSTQPLPPGGSGALVAADVSACAFSYVPGSATRQGLLKVDLGLTRGGETVTLFAQAHVVNVP